MSLYYDHLQWLTQHHQQLCQKLNLEGIALHSGIPGKRPYDDQSEAYWPDPYVQQWLPVTPPADTWIWISADGERHLFWPVADDFWHVPGRLPEGGWTEHWHLHPRTELPWARWQKHTGVLSPNQPDALPGQAAHLNSNALRLAKDYARAVKTPWEQAQIAAANDRAARGHLAAESAFLSGQSEFGIHLRYLEATEQQQAEEPYSAIIALNESAATLHYERKLTSKPEQHRTLLIDAGAQKNGYASDITRTFAQGSELFSQLWTEVEKLQLSLCEACIAERPYPDIHDLCLTGVAAILNRSGICNLPVEQQLAKQIPQVFFPHGIGHLLGMQVHDVGGFLANPEGDLLAKPDHAPYLRLTRTLAPGMVVTVEPGLYFIPMLLDQLVAREPHHGCDLTLIDQLKPWGGIRIEDNVLVTEQKPVNLTRESFSRAMSD